MILHNGGLILQKSPKDEERMLNRQLAREYVIHDIERISINYG
ncbi:MAG: hypothetical protein QFX38_05760 [Methanothermobacter sp.]|nr:hypothetical protein [Methanothermobacter sp.]